MDERFDKIDEFTLGGSPGDYPAKFLEHALHPRNAGNLKDANGFASLNSHDGSSMEIWLKVENDYIAEAKFWTEGCGTVIACGSAVTESAKGKTIQQAFDISPQEIESALDNATGQGCTCSKLAVDTMKAALRDYIAYKAEPWRRKYTKT